MYTLAFFTSCRLVNHYTSYRVMRWHAYSELMALLTQQTMFDHVNIGCKISIDGICLTNQISRIRYLATQEMTCVAFNYKTNSML